MEAWQRELIERMEESMHSSPIMLALFDQETATRNFMASVERESKLEDIKNLMETTKWSAVEVMNAMKIPVNQQSMYAAQL